MIGWPNYPERPELLAHSSNSNGFQLTVKLYPPDYLGGITEEQWRYDVFLSGSVNNFSGGILGSTVPSNPTVNMTLGTNILLLGGVGSLLNTYYITTQLALKYDPTLSLVDISALPTGSPSLVVRTFCELIG